MTSAGGWTVAMASAQFAETGIPFEERNLRAVIRHLPGFQRIGEMRAPPDDGIDHGGRGHPLYDIADLQQLHAFLARKGWLTPPARGDA